MRRRAPAVGTHTGCACAWRVRVLGCSRAARAHLALAAEYCEDVCVWVDAQTRAALRLQPRDGGASLAHYESLLLRLQRHLLFGVGAARVGLNEHVCHQLLRGCDLLLCAGDGENARVGINAQPCTALLLQV